VTARSSAWFGANCRLVYFIIDFYRQASGQACLAKLTGAAFIGDPVEPLVMTSPLPGLP
jgi:hypothetical protein